VIGGLRLGPTIEVAISGLQDALKAVEEIEKAVTA